MTVTKSQNRLRSFGAETRAEVSARRNSSKYVTRLKSIITPYKICVAKYELNFRRAFVLVLNRRREITENYLRNFALRILSFYCTMDSRLRMLLKLRLLKLRRKRLLLSLLIKQRSYTHFQNRSTKVRLRSTKCDRMNSWNEGNSKEKINPVGNIDERKVDVNS